MALKALIEKLDEVDEKYRDLYSERNGKFEFTGVEGFKTQADIDRINEALRKEKSDHKVTRERYHPLSGLEVEDIVAKLDKYPELEAAATGKIDEAAIQKMVETRLHAQVSPVKRELDKALKDKGELETAIALFQEKETRRLISDSVRTAALKSKMLDTAVEDAILHAEKIFEVTEDGAVITRDNVGVTPGINPELWLQDIQAKRPHWWAPSMGGGAPGSKGPGSSLSNPWTFENWNVTEQMAIVSQDRSKADRMAQMAGTRVGGLRPPPKR
jgi:hypothetical protein